MRKIGRFRDEPTGFASGRRMILVFFGSVPILTPVCGYGTNGMNVKESMPTAGLLREPEPYQHGQKEKDSEDVPTRGSRRRLAGV